MRSDEWLGAKVKRFTKGSDYSAGYFCTLFVFSANSQRIILSPVLEADFLLLLVWVVTSFPVEDWYANRRHAIGVEP